MMLCLSLTAHAMEKDETITLTDSKKIGYAMALNKAIDQASKKVTECAEKKLVPQENCLCLRFAKASRKKVRKKLDAQIHLVGYRRTKRLQTTPQVCPSVRLQCLNRSTRFAATANTITTRYRVSTGWPLSSAADALIVLAR